MTEKEKAVFGATTLVAIADRRIGEIVERYRDPKTFDQWREHFQWVARQFSRGNPRLKMTRDRLLLSSVAWYSGGGPVISVLMGDDDFGYVVDEVYFACIDTARVLCSASKQVPTIEAFRKLLPIIRPAWGLFSANRTKQDGNGGWLPLVPDPLAEMIAEQEIAKWLKPNELEGVLLPSAARGVGDG